MSLARETAETPGRIVLRGGRLGVGGAPRDVVLEDGRVVDICPAGQAPRRERGLEILDLRDATVLPGLVDGHVHVDQWTQRRYRIDVGAAAGPLAVAAMIRAHVDGGRGWSGELVTAHGFRDAMWDEPADRTVLDEVVGDVPVAVVSADLHAVWLSTAALVEVGRSQHPTGVLRDLDGLELLQVLTAEEPTALGDARVADTLAAAASRGVTRLVDFEHADTIAAWQRRSATHGLAVRVHAAVWPSWLDAAIAAGRHTGDIVEGTGGLLHVGPLKIMADGSLNTRTACCDDPYPHGAADHESHGLQLIERADLVTMMTHAWQGGLEPAVHAIGDRANSLALDAFEAVGCPGRIEHAQLVRVEDFRRFARRGLVTSVQPQHAVADRDVAERYWPGRTARAFAYRALEAAGARLEFGSDAPVTPLDPWLAIAAAVHRTDDDRPPWHPEQRLSLHSAVTAACAGRASVAVGDVADLTIVPGDLLSLDAAELRGHPVLATVVGGQFTYRLG